MGKDEVIERILAGILANGHILIEDYPGLAKTLIARLARPDARPGLQAHPVHARSPAQRHHRQLPLQPARGPVRVPAGPGLHQPPPRRRDQPGHAEDAGGAAGGDAGGAGDGRGRALPARRRRSSCIATQNPIELEGTYPLPEAQLDRFLMRVGRRLSRSPTRSARSSAAGERGARTRRRSPTDRLAGGAARDAGGRSRTCSSATPIERYIVELVQATRADPRVALGASPRGRLAC